MKKKNNKKQNFLLPIALSSKDAAVAEKGMKGENRKNSFCIHKQSFQRKTKWTHFFFSFSLLWIIYHARINVGFIPKCVNQLALQVVQHLCRKGRYFLSLPFAPTGHRPSRFR